MGKGNRSESFNRWGLNDNPFIPLPPQTEEERRIVFTGRENEKNALISLVNRPRGIYLVGMFGIGKSILALETLRILAEQGYVAVYVRYNIQDGFSLSVLRSMAEICSKKDIFSVYKILLSGSVKPVKPNPDAYDIKDAVDSCKSKMTAIETIIKYVVPNSKIVIVVDQLDRTDLRSIEEIIKDTRELIEYGCAVILPGHPLGPTAEFSSSADILYPLTLNPLSETELLEMMVKYLSLARSEAVSNESPYYPFTLAAAKMIAKSISELELTPRIFNSACQLLLEYAAEYEVGLINEQFITTHWNKVAEEFLVKSIHEEDKRYLEIIYRNKGISEDTRDTINEIGGQFAEYVEIKKKLSDLIQKNILIEQNKNGINTINVSPIFDKNFKMLI